MISYLRGKIINKTINYCILETGGVGYQIMAGENLLNELRVGLEAEIYTHHQVREDASDLYGFKSLADRELFELLLTVSGVGPKSALGILSLAATDDVKETIVRGDADLLTKVSGIGKKTAERIVLELKNKVLRSTSSSAPLGTPSFGGDEIDALMTLGYSLSEARSALNAVDPAVVDSGQRVKEALKKMAKR